VYTIVEGCPNLLPMNLQHTAKGDRYLAAVAATWGPGLESLDLSGFYQITDAGLATIVEGCPNLKSLKSLELWGCNQITDSGLATIVEGCPKLESLDLSDCNQITDAGLATIVEGCPNLKSLNLSRCDQITNFGWRRASMAVQTSSPSISRAAECRVS